MRSRRSAARSSTALGNALASEQAITNTQTKLAEAQLQLDQANQDLANTTKQLAVVHAQFATDQTDLSQLLVHVYELSDDGTVTEILVNSKSLQDAMDTLTSVDQVSSRVRHARHADSRPARSADVAADAADA